MKKVKNNKLNNSISMTSIAELSSPPAVNRSVKEVKEDSSDDADHSSSHGSACCVAFMI